MSPTGAIGAKRAANPLDRRWRGVCDECRQRIPMCHGSPSPARFLPELADPQTRLKPPPSHEAADILQEKAGREAGDAHPLRLGWALA